MNEKELLQKLEALVLSLEKEIKETKELLKKALNVKEPAAKKSNGGPDLPKPPDPPAKS